MQLIIMPVDQFPQKLEGINFLCRGVPSDERNVRNILQVDIFMMWETGGVQDAVCQIKIVCPAKNYEKVALEWAIVRLQQVLSSDRLSFRQTLSVAWASVTWYC